MGVGWTVSRYIYMVGYCEGGVGGKGRYKGIYFVSLLLSIPLFSIQIAFIT